MIPVVYYRSSSIVEYTNCPLRYFANHCLGLRYPAGPKAIAGTMFHSVMEYLANAKLNHEDVDGIDLEVLTKDIYDKTVDSIDFKRVPKTYHRKSGERKSIEAWIPYKDLKQSVTNVMQMQPRSFDVRKMDIVAVEQKFDVEIKEPWSGYDFVFRNKHYKGNLRLKGSIDLIVRNEDGTLSIIDWKSGRSEDMNTGEKKTMEDYQNDFQMAIYYMVTRKYLGMDVSDVTLCFLNEGQCYTLYFDEDLVLEGIKTVFEEMKQAEKPLKKDSDFCVKFCPYCKHTFADVTTKPLVKPRQYDFVNEAGLLVKP